MPKFPADDKIDSGIKGKEKAKRASTSNATGNGNISGTPAASTKSTAQTPEEKDGQHDHHKRASGKKRASVRAEGEGEKEGGEAGTPRKRGSVAKGVLVAAVEGDDGKTGGGGTTNTGTETSARRKTRRNSTQVSFKAGSGTGKTGSPAYESFHDSPPIKRYTNVFSIATR